MNALLRWYREGADVEAKLPLLATYMGHASPLSTHYYLHLIEPLRTAASERFACHYGELIVPVPARKGRQPIKRQLPNLLGAIVRDYFTDHLPQSSRNEPQHYPQLPRQPAPLLRFLSVHRKYPVAKLDFTDLDPSGNPCVPLLP